MSKEFKRVPVTDEWISGVCGGIAEYFDIDVFLVRVFFFCLSKYLIGLYIIIWLCAPRR